MNLAMQRYEAWRRQPDLDGMLANELLAMEGDAEKITDSFGCDLAFGTAASHHLLREFISVGYAIVVEVALYLVVIDASK